MRVLQFGTFDVANYGDLLFPLVARHFLPEFELSFASPRGGPPPCAGGVSSVSFDELIASGQSFDAVLIGGGNIVHMLPTKLPDYQSVLGLSNVAYPGLWLGACLLASQWGAGIAWNAPGVGASLSPPALQLLETCLRHSDYVAFRELGHLAPLKQRAANLEIVPDTAIALAGVFPEGTLLGLMANLRERYALPEKYTVFHAKARNLKTEHDKATARTILARLESAAPVLLLPLGRTHRDEVALADLVSGLQGRYRLADADLSLADITALIASASFVVSASLHGAIVAAAYGAPVTVLATGGVPKYTGFFEHIGRVEAVKSSWPEIAASIPGRIGELERMPVPHSAISAVRRHFERVASALREPRDRRPRGLELSWGIRCISYRIAPMASLLPGLVFAQSRP